jgi:UDP-glucose 4-epimerase
MLRYFNAAGADPEGDLSECYDPETHLIPLAIDAATGKGPLTLSLGTGKANSVRSVIAAVERISCRAVPPRACRAPFRRPAMLVADAALARKLIGLTPRLSDLDTIVSTAWKERVKSASARGAIPATFPKDVLP